MASPGETTMDNLPDNVLWDIFKWLLAEQLAQMRCVSKSWNALLSHSSFIKSHLHRSTKNNDEILLFFNMVFSIQLTPFTAWPSCSPHLELPNFIKLPVKLQHKYACGYVIGSVNGLICFYYVSSTDGIVFCIWNPLLSALLTLPPSPFPTGPLRFGFGFDPISDDYKVASLKIRPDSPNVEPEAVVYSIRKGSWESLKFPSHITWIQDQVAVCVDGHLHWGATELEGIGIPLRIVAFDLGAEEFFEMPVLEFILDCNWFIRSILLGVLGGKLCVMSRLGDGEWEVWVMEKYGVAESWVKHHVFPPFSGDIIPKGFTSHGEFVFQVGKDDGRIGLYDPIEAKTKTFKICTYSPISRFVEYVDSLVWIQPSDREISSCDIS